MSQLVPVPHPIVIFPAFIAQQTDTLILKGQHIGRSLDVTLASTGSPFVTVQSESASFSHRKHILDPTGTELCTIRRESKTLGNSRNYYAEAPSNNTGKATHLWDLTTKWSLGGSKYTITFTNDAGETGELFFKKDPWGTHATIMDVSSGLPVAEIDRERFKLRREYHVTVAAGVDMLLVLGVCVALDDRAQTRKSSSMGSAASAGGGAAASC